jgi:hypothetical protein
MTIPTGSRFRGSGSKIGIDSSGTTSLLVELSSVRPGTSIWTIVGRRNETGRNPNGSLSQCSEKSSILVGPENHFWGPVKHRFLVAVASVVPWALSEDGSRD